MAANPTAEPQMTIQTGAASTKAYGAHCDGILTGGEQLKKEQKHYMNALKLMAMIFAILTFPKNLSNLTIDIQMDNKVAVSYLFKMGRTESLELLKTSKSV